MSDPNTGNKLLAIPTRGSDVGVWDVPINGDMTAIDGMLGGVTTLSLSSATTFALGVPSGTLAAGAGPNQSQNALIILTGTLTGNITLQFTLPGFYIVHNQCTVGTSYVQLAPASGTGNAIGAVPGRKCHVFFDGTNMDYANPADPGTAYDLHGVNTYPAWMNACTVKPYLIKDGTIYSVSTYQALGALLGSTFGGNGITTFGVPDERNRMRVGVDTNTNGGYTNRITAPVSNINGTTMGATGGDQSMQQHTHTWNPTTQTWTANQSNILEAGTPTFFSPAGGANNYVNPGLIAPTITVTPNGTIGTTGSGASQNMPPCIISFLAMVKT